MQPLRIIDISGVEIITKNQSQIDKETRQSQHTISTEPTREIFSLESEQTHNRQTKWNKTYVYSRNITTKNISGIINNQNSSA